MTYLGDLNGRYEGGETCYMYPVNREQRQMYVDRRDAPALLKVANGKGEMLFVTASEYL